MRTRQMQALIGIGIGLGLILISAFFPKSGVCFFLILLSVIAGPFLLSSSFFFPATDRGERIRDFLLSALCFIALQSILQTAWYELGQPLSATTDGWITGLSLVCVSLASLLYVIPSDEPSEESRNRSPKFTNRGMIIDAIPLLLSLLATSWILSSAWHVATALSIRSPWPLLPHSTLWLIAFVWLCAMWSAWKSEKPWLTVLHFILAIASVLCLAPIIYRVGFGFDGFLHIASERILLETGILRPKPLYYIGQYVFTTWFARVASIPIAFVDRWLVPSLATIYLPLSLWSFTKPGLRTTDYGLRPLIILALLPLSLFIATTPQSLAFLIGLIAILLTSTSSLLESDKRGLAAYNFIPLILSLWSVSIHPLAGIPILITVIAIFCARRERRSFTTAAYLLAILVGAGVPLLFFLLSLFHFQPITWNLSNIFQLSTLTERLSSLAPWVGHHYALWPTWSSLVQKALPITLFIFGLIATIRSQNKRERATFSVFLIAAVSLWVSQALLKASSNFSFLIAYERDSYAARLDTLAILLLIPVAAIGLHIVLRNIKRKSFASIALLFFFIASATGLSYDALPRHDAMVVGRGWSTSQNDLDTVRQIDEDAHGQPYVVLANQSVSAAAVSTLGFKRYHNDVFFYPIPTGGPLYQIFLKMTYETPSRTFATEAAELTQSKNVYVVINDYWWKSNVSDEQLALISDRQWQTADGKIHVFVFENSSMSPSSTRSSE